MRFITFLLAFFLTVSAASAGSLGNYTRGAAPPNNDLRYCKSSVIILWEPQAITWYPTPYGWRPVSTPLCSKRWQGGGYYDNRWTDDCTKPFGVTGYKWVCY